MAISQRFLFTFIEMKAVHTIKEINKAIQAEIHPKLILVRGEGYYYIASDDNELALQIAGLKSSAIWVNSLKQLGAKGWVDAVREVFNKIEK
jgi:hypothetical protein